jgi:type VI secretion system secreted protein VgrG
MASHDPFTLTLESTEFDCEHLRIHKLTGVEAISRLFAFDLEVVCLDRGGVPLEAMLGASVIIDVQRLDPAGDGSPVGRRIHGMVAEVDDLMAASADLRVYRLRVTPRAHRLTLAEMQDILMGVTVPEILTQKLAAVGLEGPDVVLRLHGTYEPREFVVQYKETDLAFVSRLAEHLGISFFFDQENESDQLVFTDYAQGFGTPGHLPTLPFHERGVENDVFALEAKHRLIPTYYAVRDYNYRLPQVDLTSDHEVPTGYGGGVIEFGAHHKSPQEGKALAQVRAEERLATQLVYTGKSALPSISAGMRFKLAGHPDADELTLLVVEVEHEARQTVGGYGEGQQRYTNSFRAIPADRTYRPPRLTPRPRIPGLVTGIVDPGPTGPGRHAKLDEHGRYTVRFLFDSTAPGERPASRPVRMVQNHVGENYGTHYPLQPGVEVVLGFIDGDPDRPIIVGAVPNPLKPSPVTNAEANVHRVRTSTGIQVDMAE